MMLRAGAPIKYPTIDGNEPYVIPEELALSEVLMTEASEVPPP